MIVWLEDRKKSVLHVETAIKSLGVEIEDFAQPVEVFHYLREMYENNAKTIKLPTFLIDLNIHGVNDLKDLGIEDSDTESGVHAGYVFADLFLRDKNRMYKKANIAFFTERVIDDKLRHDVKALNRRGCGEAHVFNKFDESDKMNLLSLLEVWL